MAVFGEDFLRAAAEHLASVDAKMSTVIAEVGQPTLKTRRERFPTLVRSILSQQISGAAARTIQLRVKNHIGRFTPASVGQLSVDEFRELGVSKQKASYLLDLADKANRGELRFARHGRMADEEVISELIQVKGIGRWTAQMYLIFSLGRSDVFPEDDLGVRNGMHVIYGLDDGTERAKLRDIAEGWRPYRSIGAWYCWRSLETST